jgi:hypothetical protein
MLITKPKSKLFIGLTKNLETKIFDKNPKKGLIFEFESLSYDGWLEVTTWFNTLGTSEDKDKASKEFVEFARSKVIKVHNKDLTADQFHIDLYIPLMIALSSASIVSEDDSFFSE